ncbi:hypothetical protein EMPS_07476 [Entomortierella parvispora]|uniref:Leucine-rich repeat-containing N-terminal plant-type domain-containing protein n=1 Tax=Entomortierella parvispora TaxID=205924 RepID=A0A9P3HEL9_9FUNG|nr:hypothetical protein EMPS_07476 [Entomortierella parvispora]
MVALQRRYTRTLGILLFLHTLHWHPKDPSRSIFFAAAEESTPIVLPPSSSILDSPDSPSDDQPLPPIHGESSSILLPLASRIPSLYPPGSLDHSNHKAPVPSNPPKSGASRKTTHIPSSTQSPTRSHPATSGPTENPVRTTRNKAASALGLVHVPLKVSCEILRRLYNSTGGISWSNQDGWQYVDSATESIPGQGNRGRSYMSQNQRNRKKRTPVMAPTRRTFGESKRIRDRDNDHDAEEGPDRRPPDHDAPSIDHVPSPQPQSPSSTSPQKPESPAVLPPLTDNRRPRPSGPDLNDNYYPIGSDPSIGPAPTPMMDMDPNNCCAWYGVVCIGPDGTLPPPWPPYDEDLVASRVGNPISPPLTAGQSANPAGQNPSTSGGPGQNTGPFVVGPLSPSVPAFGKRSAYAPLSRKKRAAPYYNYHDRNQQHHGKDGRNKNPGHPKSPIKGGANNQHLPDDGNNEGGKPLADPDEDEDEKHAYGSRPPLSPSAPSGKPIDVEESPDYEYQDPLHPPPTTWQRPLMDDWYIIELHLGFNGLTGPVPEELTELVNLLILDISNNELTGEIPETYGNLTRLKRFDVSSNKITGAFPVAVNNMVNIQELVLKNNYLTGPLPGSILKLKQMTELSIANNEFDGLIPDGLFASLRKLRVVNINQNGFTGEIGPEVGGLTGLVKFSARANEFSGPIPKEFGYCKQLVIIDLGDNHFQGEIPESIFGLPNLKNLDLTDNKLSGSLSPKIGHMISITRLILSHNNFSGPLPVEIQNLTRLEYMVLNYNHFDGLFPIAIAPPQITVCLVQPNAFTACPPNASVETSTTLAYQCNLDCRGTVPTAELS